MISTALRAAAAFVDDHAITTAWDSHQRLSDEQRLAKGEKIQAAAVELLTLADAVETRKVSYPEYEVLKDRLYAFGLVLPTKLAQDIAIAFREAEGPAKRRGPGWLKGQGGA